MSFSSLVEALRERALSTPDFEVFTFLHEGEVEAAHLTFSELDQRASCIAAELRQRLQPGERVGLLYDSGLESIAALFGCFYAGLVAVPLPFVRAHPERARARLRLILEDAEAAALLTAAAWLGLREAPAASSPATDLPWIATDTIATGPTGAPHSPKPQSAALLQYTSGSTGAPKGVIVTHGNLVANSAQMEGALGGLLPTCAVGWLPFWHDFGLVHAMLQPIYSGYRRVLLAPEAFLEKPVRWLAAISRYRASHSEGPNFAYDLCARRATAAERASLDLRCWQTALNAAEPIRLATLERFAAAFEPCGFRKTTLMPCYGLAEATVAVSAEAVQHGPCVLHVDKGALAAGRVQLAAAGGRAQPLVGSGRIMAGIRVLAVDPESCEPCDAEHAGELWIAGANVAPGYWRREAESAATFQARLADGAGPFLRTGDLGFVRDNEIFVTGRLKDLIIVRGRNFYPQDLEAAAERAHPGIRAGGCAAFGMEVGGEERPVLVCELRAGFEPREVVHAVRSGAASDEELALAAVALIEPGTLLKTTSGKVMRRACQEAYRAGRFAVVAQWQEDATEMVADGGGDHELGALVRSQAALVLGFAEEEIRDGIDLPSLGLDSFLSVELAQRLEQRLGRSVPATVVAKHRTPEAIAAALNQPARYEREIATCDFCWVTGEADLRRAHQLLEALPEEELSVLPPLNHGYRPLPYDELAQRVSSKELEIILAVAHDSGKPAGLFLGCKRPRLLYMSAQGVQRRERVLELYGVILEPYRGRLDPSELFTWMRGVPELLGRLQGLTPTVALATRASVGEQQARVLAAVLATGPVQEARLVHALFERDDEALAEGALERVWAEAGPRRRLEASVARQSYEGTTGAELLALTERPPGELEAKLDMLLPVTRLPLLRGLVRLARAGRATFAGYELRWLEPVFFFEALGGRTRVPFSEAFRGAVQASSCRSARPGLQRRTSSADRRPREPANRG